MSRFFSYIKDKIWNSMDDNSNEFDKCMKKDIHLNKKWNTEDLQNSQKVQIINITAANVNIGSSVQTGYHDKEEGSGVEAETEYEDRSETFVKEINKGESSNGQLVTVCTDCDKFEFLDTDGEGIAVLVEERVHKNAENALDIKSNDVPIVCSRPENDDYQDLSDEQEMTKSFQITPESLSRAPLLDLNSLKAYDTGSQSDVNNNEPKPSADIGTKIPKTNTRPLISQGNQRPEDDIDTDAETFDTALCSIKQRSEYEKATSMHKAERQKEEYVIGAMHEISKFTEIITRMNYKLASKCNSEELKMKNSAEINETGRHAITHMAEVAKQYFRP